ncbi:MAG TPA: hypothetical protein VMU08_08535 [Rhizomicrobium sp.]|nr:hypothetical protein [Rhizomicrobium sp.]
MPRPASARRLPPRPAPVAAAAPFLPSDILSDRGRIFRPPLMRWALSLARQFRNPAHPSADPRHTYEVCALANNASLLFALAGESDFAETVCEKQLAWLHRRMLAGGGAAAASLAIQPWVNIGRLYRQRGESARALAQFAAIFPAPDGAPLAFGPFRLEQEDILFEDVELLYVVDALRTFHAARDYERGLRFARKLRPRLSSCAAIPRLDEYAFQFALCCGYARAAGRVLDRSEWQDQPQLMLVNAFYRCILLAAEGGDTGPIVSDLAGWACGALAGTSPDHSTLRFALDLARFARDAGSPGPAEALAPAGYDAATRHEDVPLRFEFARLAGALGAAAALPPPEEILVHSGYVGFARRHGIALVPAADARAALETLRAALMTALW